LWVDSYNGDAVKILLKILNIHDILITRILWSGKDWDAEVKIPSETQIPLREHEKVSEEEEHSNSETIYISECDIALHELARWDMDSDLREFEII